MESPPLLSKFLPKILNNGLHPFPPSNPGIPLRITQSKDRALSGGGHSAPMFLLATYCTYRSCDGSGFSADNSCSNPLGASLWTISRIRRSPGLRGLAEDEEGGEEEGKEGPAAALTVEEDQGGGVGEAGVAEAEEVVEEGEGEEGASLVLLWVVDDGGVEVAEDAGEAAAVVAVAEVEGEESGFREVLVEVREDLAEVEAVHSVRECLRREAGIED